MKKKVNLTLDKLDQEYLVALKERTGKSDAEILKMALNELHRKLVEGAMDNKQPEIIYVYPQTLFPPYQPPQFPTPFITQPSPLAPFDPREIIITSGTADTIPPNVSITGNNTTGTTIVNILNDELPISTTGYKYPPASEQYKISARKDL